VAPVLAVCDGTVHVTGGDRETIPLAKLFHAPDRGIRSEHDLAPAELITGVSLRPAPASGFSSIKEKQSFDWPLVMAAAALEMDGDRIRSARICAGAVAPVPWPLPRVEEALRGVRVTDEAALGAACAVASERGRPLSDNAYKLRLLPVAVRRAVLKAAGRSMEATR
jgi:xanthine dehydrogenase YagS FAD-binding subunit